MIEIRELNGGDLAAWVRVGAQAYRRGDLGDGVARWPEGDFTRFGLFEGGQLVAQYHLWHYEIFFGGQRMPMGGVASVACLPLARGKRYVEALLQHGLEQMRERGEVVSMLHAFLVGLYRPMGWEWIGSRRSYTVPLTHLPSDLPTGAARAAGPEDAERLQALYEAEAARYRGTLVRPLSWWQERLEATTGFTHYFFLYGDPVPQGYLYLHLREPARVRELFARTPEAYQSLLGVLRRHKAQIDKVVWDAPPDDPLWHTTAHWEIETKWRPPFSGRVVDVPAALSLLRPAETLAGRCRVRVEDRLAPWNTGCWQIGVEDGRVSATPSAKEPQVAGDIGAWSQLFFGDPDADSLRRAGRLAVSDERAYAVLRALCPPALCWTNDGF